MKRVSLRIHGRVQGVYYRKSCQQAARRLGVRGWVANEAGGCVIVEAEGESAALSAFLDWCREGPPLARVSRVEVLESEIGQHESRFSGFEVRY